eukprot:TRINITY_DN3221_c0_g2_i1.p1 TRINITY_DN3221_c0_g2~~TRINITY_DN3221_c0_g2_i1.p1  ORF type:complete len:508 (+),score=202.15 TRINITY_DN3221_c0_g2_i1:64-1587(+)
MTTKASRLFSDDNYSYSNDNNKNENKQFELENQSPGGIDSDLTEITNKENSSKFKENLIIFTILLGISVVCFSITVLTIVLPQIAFEFQSSDSDVTWVATSMSLAAATLTSAFGRIGDTIGRKKTWILGSIIANGSFLVSAFAPKLWILVLGRILTGVGAAAMMPSGLAILISYYSVNDKTTPIGYYSSATAIAPSLGVAAGGLFVEYASWRWIFILQLIFGLPSLIATSFLLKESHSQASGRFDYFGALFVAIASSTLLYAINQGPEIGWTSWPILLNFGLFIVTTILLVYVEIYRAENPVLPLKLFTKPIVTFAFSSSFLVAFVYAGALIISPYFMVAIQGYEIGIVALFMCVRPLSVALFSLYIGKILQYTSEVFLVVSSSILLVIASILFTIANETTALWIMLIALVAQGISLGIGPPIFLTVVLQTVESSMHGTINGMAAMFQTISMTIGMTLFLALVVQFGGIQLLLSYQVAFSIGAICAFLYFFTCFALSCTIKRVQNNS